MPNLASSLLLACVGLFALPGQAQTAVFDPAAGICGRTEEVRDGIVDSISGVTDCANVTDAHLAAITGTLDLSAEGITALAAGDFDGLTALTTLVLWRNSLSTLPAGVFDDLTALTWLDLDSNSLSTLPAGVFDGLTGLRSLYLENNSLTTLPAGVFDELTALTSLVLYSNSLTALPAGVFDELTGLTQLYLFDNSLDTLPDDVFEDLTELTRLRLQDNPGAPFAPTADALPDDGEVLVGPGGTVTLDGSGSDGGPWGTNVTYGWAASGAAVTFDDAASVTPVATIPALADGTELTFTLTVTGRAGEYTVNGTAPDTDTATVTAVFDSTAGICGRTEEVRTAILGEISDVRNCANVTDAHLAAITGTLDLGNKGITALAAGDFDGLTALEDLLLFGNSLSTLPAGVFDGLTALEELSLEGNSLSTLPAGVFDELTALEGLNLENNSLSTLPAGVFDELTALEGLGLGYNSLSTLPAGVFDELTALELLWLHNNSLDTLPDDVFEDLTELTRLRLRDNPGAPFAPTADALPDDGEVLVGPGGTVTLDGSGSDGGPWGTNVTYGWAASGAAVTFDDAASVAPVATIPALADGTELTFTLTVTGRGGTNGTAPDTDTATVTAVFDSTAGICGRTEEVRDGIVDSISGVTACANVTDAHLAAITGTLDLGNKGITALAAGDFDGLTALEELYLYNNSLSTLPAGVFDGLTALTSLWLGENSLATLPTGVFDELTGLTTLWLSNNSLETLPAGVFDELTALEELYLQNNSLSTLSAGVFDELTALTSLNLWGNSLSTLPAGVFDGLTALTSLELWGNSLSTLPAGVFDGLTGLRVLSLGNNSLTTLPAGVFDELTGLTTLWLSNNSLETLPAGVFDELTALEELYLQNNSLSTLSAGVFDELTALTQLRLHSNSLTTLPAGVFDGLTALTLLHLYNNSLSTLPAGVFDELTALTELILENNYLSTLPVGVFDGLTELRGLHLGNNSLTTLPAGVFDGLTALTSLDLWGNSLSTLPAGVFDELTALEYLSLSGNSLTTLPAGVFDGLTALTWLSLENNSLTTLPAGVFDELTSLTTLWLYNNSLSTLPAGVFDKLTALTSLSLSDNSLTTLPAGVFDELTALTSLSLSNNSLETLPAGVFDELTALTTLRLDDNPGAPFSPTADALPDDGTVPASGGTVTLDGSGSGGAWGTNVTYSWALTSPASGVTVTFDDDTSVTPEVTIPALTAGAELAFTLTVTGRGAGGYFSGGFDPDTDTATVTAVTAANESPSFTSPAAFSAPENQTAVGTVAASDSDGGDSVTGYAIHGGADVSKFSIAPSTGVLTFASAPNFEAPADADTGNDYVVVVRATSGTGARAKAADQTITATVTDMGGEAPGIPAAPSVSSASATSLNVFWTAPANAGPAITDYDYRHRVASPRGSWTEVTTTTITGLGATIAGLAENTEYDVQVRATNDDGEGAWSQPGSGSTGEVAVAGLFPRASDMVRQGFVRVINHSAEAGEATVAAIDDGGMRAGPVVLTLAGGATAHFNSDDLEAGNADKGLPEGVGPPGEGDWRLELESELDIEVLSYIRTEDGFLTAMHDVAPVADGEHRVAISNPAVNTDQASRLRLINPTAEDAEVVVTGVDDDGASPGTEIVIDLPAGESATLTPPDLETGAGLDGALGDGAGKWRLAVASVRPIVVMSLLSSPTGHLTNLSTVPPGADDDGRHQVPLFPSASDPLGRQGFLRIVNRSADAGTVQVQAYDDSDVAYGIVTVAIGVGRTVHFNSDDLELGNADKGLAGSTGAGTGDWRLALSSDDLDDIQVLAYIRHDDGFLTSMHDVAPRVEGGSRVAIFNPGSNPDQVSSLRLVNPTAVDAEVTVTGIDDAGASPGTAVVLTVPAGDSRTLDAATLEDGGEDLDGALGDGKGKWRLVVTSEQPIVVMSLMTSATGQLTNLSTAPDRDGT